MASSSSSSSSSSASDAVVPVANTNRGQRKDESGANYFKRKVDVEIKKDQLAALDVNSKVQLNDDVKGRISDFYEEKPKMTPAAVFRNMYDKAW